METVFMTNRKEYAMKTKRLVSLLLALVLFACSAVPA